MTEPKPSYALCPLPPPAPNVEFTCPRDGCGALFYTDETGQYWLHRWCDDHGEPDDCKDAVKRIYSVAEYRRLTALPLRTIKIQD